MVRSVPWCRLRWRLTACCGGWKECRNGVVQRKVWWPCRGDSHWDLEDEKEPAEQRAGEWMVQREVIFGKTCSWLPKSKEQRILISIFQNLTLTSNLLAPDSLAETELVIITPSTSWLSIQVLALLCVSIHRSVSPQDCEPHESTTSSSLSQSLHSVCEVLIWNPKS